MRIFPLGGVLFKRVHIVNRLLPRFFERDFLGFDFGREVCSPSELVELSQLIVVGMAGNRSEHNI